jgi:hypothetical protein
MQMAARGSASSELDRPSQAQHDIGHDVIEYLKQYAREKPEVAALWCFGIGFILGWKLKPW